MSSSNPSRTSIEYIVLSDATREQLGEQVRPQAMSGGALTFVAIMVGGLVLFQPFLLRVVWSDIFFYGIIVISTLFFLYMLLLSFFNASIDVESHTVQYVKNERMTWFSQETNSGPVSSLFFACICSAFVVHMVFAAVITFLESDGNVFAIPRWIWVWLFTFCVVTPFAWRFFVLSLRENPGVRVTPDGVMMDRNARDVHVDWDEIYEVRADTLGVSGTFGMRKVPYLVVLTRGYKSHWVGALQMGSDPNVVAAFIQYYLEHRWERRRLSDPEDAIRSFRDAQMR